MAIIPSLLCLPLSPFAGKKSTMPSFEVFRQKTHKWIGCGSFPWGSRAWEGDTGEVDVTAEPWEPLARQGMCKGSICWQKHLGRPLHRRGINGKSRQGWLREERQLEITQNQVKRSWRMGEGRLWLIYWVHMTQQLHSSGRLRTEGLNVIPEIIKVRAKGEYLAAQSVDRRVLASLNTRQCVAKEN